MATLQPTALKMTLCERCSHAHFTADIRRPLSEDVTDSQGSHYDPWSMVTERPTPDGRVAILSIHIIIACPDLLVW